MLADKLKKYANQPTVVIALNQGSVLIGAQIAMSLHANLLVLLSDNIMLPGEPKPFATMTENTYTYNNFYNESEREEIESEYHGVIEDEKRKKLYSLHRLTDKGGEIDRKYLRQHVIILVSDGLQDGQSLEVAADFLKPIKVKRLVIATPLATVNAVDKMHLIGDEIHCLGVVENMMETDHYYDDNNLPKNADIQKIIKNISLNWTL